MKTDIYRKVRKTSRTYVLLETKKVCLYQISKIANYRKVIKVSLGDNSIAEPPDPIPNSEVKCNSADGSVGVPM